MYDVVQIMIGWGLGGGGGGGGYLTKLYARIVSLDSMIHVQ